MGDFLISSDLNKKFEEQRNAQMVELKQRSRDLSDLLVWENFTVDESLVDFFQHRITPRYESKIRENYISYETGMSAHTTIKVYPENDILTRMLSFRGNPFINSGDKISALIPRYKNGLDEYPFLREMFDSNTSKNSFYLDRDFQKEEGALFIKILGEDDFVLRSYSSVDFGRYKSFLK